VESLHFMGLLLFLPSSVCFPSSFFLGALWFVAPAWHAPTPTPPQYTPAYASLPSLRTTQVESRGAGRGRFLHGWRRPGIVRRGGQEETSLGRWFPCPLPAPRLETTFSRPSTHAQTTQTTVRACPCPCHPPFVRGSLGVFPSSFSRRPPASPVSASARAKPAPQRGNDGPPAATKDHLRLPR